MIRKIKRRFSNYLSFGNPLVDLIVSFAVSFLVIIFYSFSRLPYGFSFTELHASVTAVYLKFLLFFLGCGLFLFFTFCIILRRSDWLDFVLLVAGIVLSVLIAGTFPQSFPLCLILFLLMAVLLNFYFIHRKRNLFNLSEKTPWLLAGFSLAIVFLIVAIAFLKHWTFFSYDLDLGYFDQVFYSMSKSLRPVYTIMGEQINHFQHNHFSPILYLLLPGYWIFSTPEYLILIQAVFVGLAVIPLYKLCAAHRLEKEVALFICIGFLLQPGILSGQFFDFHENALLPFFLFGLLYYLTIGKKAGIMIFFLLTLMIKEDVVVYLVAIGLFELLRSGGSKKTALLMIGASAVYFVLVSRFILDTSFFHNRYENLIDSGGSYLDILKILFTNPLYLFTQSFTSEKVFFMGLVFLPLALLPLFGLLHLSEIPLFLPMIAINLLSSWWPQYSINFQYTFGTIPLFVFIAARFLSSLSKPSSRTMLAALMAVSGLIFSVSFHIEKYDDYVVRYRENQTELLAMQRALEKIPAEASVSAASHMVPHVSQRDEIYTFGLKNDTDFILLDLRGNGAYVGDTYEGEIPYLTAILDLMERQGYGAVDYFESWFLLLQRDSAGVQNEAAIDTLRYKIRKLNGEFD